MVPMDIRKLFIYLFIDFIFWIFWSFSKLDKNGGRVCWRCDREVADPGEGSGGAPPLFLDQTETQRGAKFFLETGSLSPLSQGLDSAL